MSSIKKIAVLIATIVLVTLFIFSNSMKNSAESNSMSGIVLAILSPITNFIDGIFGEQKWNYIIRKGAHITEFCILGITVSVAVNKVKKYMGWHLFGYSLFYVLLVAVTDEFIQIFSGRTSSVIDVFIDLAGALVGITLVSLVVAKKRKNTK